MTTIELKNMLGQKIVGTHLTLLEYVGLKYSEGEKSKRHTFKIQCDCGTIREMLGKYILTHNKTCGQKSCSYSTALLKSAGVKGGRISGPAVGIQKRKDGVILENTQYGFCLTTGVFKSYIRGAKVRGIIWSLTPQDIEALWIQQGGRCKITGLQLTCGTTNKNRTWSLDRIDNNKPYTKDNVQIVSKIYNMVKATRTDREMQLMAYLICQNIGHEELRSYNRMTVEEISTTLKGCTKINRK